MMKAFSYIANIRKLFTTKTIVEKKVIKILYARMP